MSTTFYIRTYNCSFPTKAADCTSRNQALNFFYNDGASVVGVSGNLFYNSVDYTVNLVTINASNDPYRTLLKSSNTNSNYTKVPKPYIYQYLNGTGIYSVYNKEIAQWVAQGWTAGTLATFKTELCTWFNTAKNYDDNDDVFAWGSDNNHVNMILFACTFDNDAGKTYYLPVFYMGNDPLADETIVI